MSLIATLTILAGLSLTLYLAAASYMKRGALRRGLFILALAIGLTASSVYSIYPALSLAEGQSDLAFRAAEIEQLRVERDQLAADLSQRTRDNEALSKTSAFFSKLHRERLTRIADEVRNVKDIVLGPNSGMVIAPDTNDVSLTSFIEGPSGFESILAELKKLKSLRVRAPNETIAPSLAMLGPARAKDAGTTGVIVDVPAASAPAAVSAVAALEEETLQVLRKALDSKMATPSYRVEALGDPELVAGRTGRYYLVELKNPKTGDRFTFDSGKYTFQSSRDAFKAAFSSFAIDVLRQLEGRAGFDLFVRGNADGQSYYGQLEPGYEYRKVAYLPSSSKGKYLQNLATVQVPGTVKNADLPNLRGEYLRQFMAELYPTKAATLLEGSVSKRDNPAARNTELIVYIAW